MANSVDPDQMPHSVVCNTSLQCLLRPVCPNTLGYIQYISAKVKEDCYSRLALWVKFSADGILKYFSYFSQKTGFDISCKLSPFFQKTGYDILCKLSPKETICMKCQILFSGKNKKNIINLSSAENAQRVVKVKHIVFITISI